MSSSSNKPLPLHSSESPYLKGAEFLVIPADLHQDFGLCRVKVDALDGYTAWLNCVEGQGLPRQEELLLIEFQDRFVHTHRTRILERRDNRILVAQPSLSEKEESQLAPTTGRHDYRVQVSVPVQIRYLVERPGSLLQAGQLFDLSRGGMSFLARDGKHYTEGDQLNLQVVSWEYPVNIDGVVTRVQVQDEAELVAVKFKDDINVRQREMISAFIIQVQRRDALSRALPAEEA